MTNNKKGDTEFIDTLIEAYNSMDQAGKEKLNKIVMSIYVSINKDKKLSEEKKSLYAEMNRTTNANGSKGISSNDTQAKSNKTKLSSLFNSLKAISQIDK